MDLVDRVTSSRQITNSYTRGTLMHDAMQNISFLSDVILKLNESEPT